MQTPSGSLTYRERQLPYCELRCGEVPAAKNYSRPLANSQWKPETFRTIAWKQLFERVWKQIVQAEPNIDGILKFKFISVSIAAGWG